MKKLIFILALAFTGGNAAAQEMINDAPSLGGSNAEIKFEADAHEFGKIKQNAPVTYKFSFKNTGREPLIIKNAEATCGCTVPDWPKQPIRPGETASITVTYNAAAMGGFNKVIKIHSNARNAPVQELKISGTVVAAGEESK